jgi:hypothetical protein
LGTTKVQHPPQKEKKKHMGPQVHIASFHGLPIFLFCLPMFMAIFGLGYIWQGHELWLYIGLQIDGLIIYYVQWFSSHLFNLRKISS